MIVELKTKDLIKLFNPSKDNIEINGLSTILDIKSLDKLVKNPNLELFSNSEDEIKNFYNKLAFYIINYEDNIHIDMNLEKNNPSNIIENGLIHFIANFYLKKETIFANITDNKIGQNFIKVKKLHETLNNTQPYKDLINFSEINFGDQILVDNFFTWNNGESDNEKDVSFYLKNLIEVSVKKNVGSNDYLNGLNKLVDIYKQIPEKVINDPYFKDEIFNNENLSDNFFELFKKGYLFIDFSSNEIKDKILNELENFNFRWVENIYYAKTSYNRTEAIDKITYTDELYNHPNLIQSFIKGNSFKSIQWNDFNLKNIYPKLKVEHKENKEIVLAYILDCEKERSSDRHKWINEEYLFKIPVKMFKDLDILKRVSHTINWETLKREFIQQKETPPKLEKEFILDIAENLEVYQFKNLISKFFKTDTFDEEFKKLCLKKNPRLFEHTIFDSMLDNIDSLIFLKDKIKIRSEKIPFNSVLPFLFKDDLNSNQKDFIYKYMIESKKINSSISELKIPKELQEEFKNRYHKPEYMFYKIDNYSHWRDYGIKMIKKIKSPEEMLMFFNNVQTYDYDIDYQSIFSGISPELRSNPDIMFSFLKNIGQNIDLTQCGNFLYNKKNCIKLLDFDISLRKYIPEQMYYDKDFSLELAKKLDENPNFNNIPVKVKKFFEQKEINQNYYNFLKSFISYNEMIKDIDSGKTNNTKKKQIKI